MLRRDQSLAGSCCPGHKKAVNVIFALQKKRHLLPCMYTVPFPVDLFVVYFSFPPNKVEMQINTEGAFLNPISFQRLQSAESLFQDNQCALQSCLRIANMHRKQISVCIKFPVPSAAMVSPSDHCNIQNKHWQRLTMIVQFWVV